MQVCLVTGGFSAGLATIFTILICSLCVTLKKSLGAGSIGTSLSSLAFLGVHPRTGDRTVWGRGHLPISGEAWGMVLQGCEARMIGEASSELKAKLNPREAHLNF